MTAERDLYELSNQLGGYSDESTPDDLHEFLIKASNDAADLAAEITRLRAELADTKDDYLRRHHDVCDMMMKNIELERRAATARLEGWEACREAAAKVAETDLRTNIAKEYGFEPDWLKHAKRIASAIRALQPEGGGR